MVDCRAITLEEMKRCKEKLLQEFQCYKWIGYFPIELGSKNSNLTVQRWSFCISYLVWFVLTTFVLIRWLMQLGVHLIRENRVIGGSLIFAVWGFTPGLTAFAFFKIANSLPMILEEISRLYGKDTKFHRPLVWREKKYTLLFSFITISNFIFVEFYLLYITPQVSETKPMGQSTFVSLILFVLCQPCITTMLCSKFIDILHTRLYAIKKQFDISYENFRKLLPRCESSPADWEDELKTAGDSIEQMQEIIRLINNGFMRYVTSLNLMIIALGSIPCIIVMLRMNAKQSVIYAIPVLVSAFLLLQICNTSWSLSNEYEDLLFTVRRLSLLKRRYPGRLPYDELHQLQELLSSSPLQVVTFGGTPLGPRLFAVMIGLIFTYTVLVEDLLNMERKYPVANESDSNNLTGSVSGTDINNWTDIINVTGINN